MHYDKRVALAVAGVTAAGIGFGTAYYLYRKQTDPSSLVTLPIRLEKYHQDYLEQMAEMYTQSDHDKAFQAIVMHCMNAALNDSVEDLIFKTIRCNSCGQKEKVAFEATVSRAQAQFITAMIAKHDIGGGDEKVVRILFEYCINDVDDANIFAQ